MGQGQYLAQGPRLLPGGRGDPYCYGRRHDNSRTDRPRIFNLGRAVSRVAMCNTVQGQKVKGQGHKVTYQQKNDIIRQWMVTYTSNL